MYGQNVQPLTGNGDVSIGEKFWRGTKNKTVNIGKIYAVCFQVVSDRCNIDIFTQSSVREYEIIPTGSVKKINVHPFGVSQRKNSMHQIHVFYGSWTQFNKSFD